MMKPEHNVAHTSEAALPPAHWPRFVRSTFPHSARLLSPKPMEARYTGRIGLLDASVDITSPVFQDANLHCRDFVARAPNTHGTIAATALVGQLGEWHGVIPRATLFAAGVLGSGSREITARAVANGLLWLEDMEVEAILMPFGHPFAHRRLIAMIDRLDPKIRLYAAAGNHGAEQLLFPAGHERVTAVSAINLDGNIALGCCARPEVALLAPGHLWVPGGQMEGSSAACVLSAAEL